MRLLAVNHHYVRDEEARGGIHPVSFAELLRRVLGASKIFRPIDARTLAAGLDGDAVGDALVVTFDDGLAEQAHAARRLADHGIPSICFVPTAPIVDGRLLDVHRIHLLRSTTGDAEIAAELASRFGATFTDLDMEQARSQYRYDADPARQVKFFLNFVLAGQEREAWTQTAFARHCGEERAAALGLYMDVETIRDLAKVGALGCHGHSHKPLARLTEAEQRADLGLSRQILEDIVGPVALGLAYPYGGPDAVDARTIAVAAELGFVYGFTMRRGINTWTGASDAPLALSRIDTNDVEGAVSGVWSSCESH